MSALTCTLFPSITLTLRHERCPSGCVDLNFQRYFQTMWLTLTTWTLFLNESGRRRRVKDTFSERHHFFLEIQVSLSSWPGLLPPGRSRKYSAGSSRFAPIGRGTLYVYPSGYLYVPRPICNVSTDDGDTVFNTGNGRR